MIARESKTLSWEQITSWCERRHWLLPERYDEKKDVWLFTIVRASDNRVLLTDADADMVQLYLLSH